MHVFDEALVADPYCLTRIRSTYELTKERDDQSRADVVPTPAGEVDPKDPSRVVEHAHQDNVVSDWSALGGRILREST